MEYRGVTMKVVKELPEIGESESLYLVENDQTPISNPVYEEWVWIKKLQEWTKLGTTATTETKPEVPKMRPTNCKNCGAPIGNGKCKYCGTEY